MLWLWECCGVETLNEDECRASRSVECLAAAKMTELRGDGWRREVGFVERALVLICVKKVSR